MYAPAYSGGAKAGASAPEPADAAVLFDSVTDGLKHLYRQKIRPVEELYKFGEFYQPIMSDHDFDAKPMVLLLGQYSTGKTSFIRYLLGRDFPGQHIGPEPTTDRFIAVMHGAEEKVTPGNALAVSASMPFRGLELFGNGFLTKFQGSQLPNDLLDHLTIVDTPGVLSGEKQRISRGYNMVGVCEWFAARADMILLLFDAHKLDISDEFKAVIESLRGHDDKVRVVLNKADQVNAQQLMRVYGALMWSLGKVFKSPEVCRVYIGSFWNQPFRYTDNAKLFEKEMQDLMRDLRDIPRNAAVRKVNELVKRVRLARVHAHLIGHMKKEMPAVFGKDKKQAALIANMEDVFLKVHRANHLPVGDFPDVQRFKASLSAHDISKFPKFNKELVDAMDLVLSRDIPKLMEQFPHEGHYKTGVSEKVAAALPPPPVALPLTGPAGTTGDLYENTPASSAPPASQPGSHVAPGCSGLLEQASTAVSAATAAVGALTFAGTSGSDGGNGGIGGGASSDGGMCSVGGGGSASPWDAPAPTGGGPNPFADSSPPAPVWTISPEEKAKYDEVFSTLSPSGGKVSGAAVRPVLERSNLPIDTLRRVWELSDVDKDGQLDADEFALAMHLVRSQVAGKPLPATLPPDLVPPSKRSPTGPTPGVAELE